MPLLLISVSFGIFIAMLYIVAVTTDSQGLVAIASFLAMAALYISITSPLVFINKYLSGVDKFPFPACLITLHMLTCNMALSALNWISPDSLPATRRIEKMSIDEKLRFRGACLCIGLLQAATLVLENKALQFGGVGFMYVLKECGLIPLYALTVLAGQERFSSIGAAFVGIILFGGLLFVEGEVNFVLKGCVLQVLSVCSKSLQLVLQCALLTQGIGQKLDVASYLHQVCPLCTMVLLPVAACEVAFAASPSKAFSGLASCALAIVLSCLLALSTNFVIAFVVKRMNALGFSFLGCFKSAVIIACAFVVLQETITLRQFLGCAMIFAASTGHAWRKSAQKPADAIPEDDKENAGQAAKGFESPTSGSRES